MDRDQRVKQALRRYATVFVVFTMALGVFMRWGLVAGFPAGLDFGHLRHAHSHAGYFGVLVAGWWLVARAQGIPISPRAVHAYALSALLTSVLFAGMGYRWPTMALSTLLAGFWLHGGLLQWRARGGAWLDGAPAGLVAGVSLVPVVAVMARRDFEFSRDLAHLFLALLLFTVFAPAAWQASGYVRRRSILVHLVLSSGGAVGLIFPAQTSPVGPLMLAFFALWLLWVVVVESPWGWHWRVLWSVFPMALLAAAAFPALHGHPWRMAGLHTITLGPILMTLAWFAFRVHPPLWLTLAYGACVGLMNALLVMPTWVDLTSSAIWVAAFSTGTAVTTLVVLLHGRRAHQHN